ncbi:hypothetical protein GCM10012275_29000 [Longimycelium tulufanense]|uniref:Uncharacterized protein n=1 Tax=Longimycelium tulufanense TaxID=907463 RepID=A0A8J3C8Q2_9PSEU|nr:XRE family transcriptional regulator [Longimycelium tulufanense]GGM56073.1 hypothetical protein GCM10012275_29000 [Longimycelium tulufanense]
MAKDWQAVAAAMQKRLSDLDMTQAELVQRARVAPMTVRELLFNERPRRRSPRTLAAISEALGWSSGHLAAIRDGTQPTDPDDGDPILTELDTIKEQLTALTQRLDAVERQLAADDERS